MVENPFVGTWSYRSFLNNPDIGKSFDALEFGRGTLSLKKPNSLHSKERSAALTGR